jgi:hypothetical protein
MVCLNEQSSQKDIPLEKRCIAIGGDFSVVSESPIRDYTKGHEFEGGSAGVFRDYEPQPERKLPGIEVRDIVAFEASEVFDSNNRAELRIHVCRHPFYSDFTTKVECAFWTNGCLVDGEENPSRTIEIPDGQDQASTSHVVTTRIPGRHSVNPVAFLYFDDFLVGWKGFSGKEIYNGSMMDLIVGDLAAASHIRNGLPIYSEEAPYGDNTEEMLRFQERAGKRLHALLTGSVRKI